MWSRPRARSTSLHRRQTISPRRRPVRASNRIAVTGKSTPYSSSSLSRACARRLSSWGSRNLCILRTAGFFIPRAGLSGRSFRSTANCRMLEASATHCPPVPRPVATLPAGRLPDDFSAVWPPMTVSRRCSTSARLIACTFFFPRRGIRWSLARPRSLRRVLSFLWAAPEAKYKSHSSAKVAASRDD
jgi:hypothetical protein